MSWRVLKKGNLTLSTFSDIAAQVEAFAKAAVAEGEQEIEKLIGEAVEVTEEAAEAVAPIVKTELAELTSQFGQLASQLVLSLMGAAGAALSGTAKANLGATSLISAAFKQGVTILDSDASTLIKNAFVAVDDVVTSSLAAA